MHGSRHPGAVCIATSIRASRSTAAAAWPGYSDFDACRHTDTAASLASRPWSRIYLGAAAPPQDEIVAALDALLCRVILNHMVKYREEVLDRTFAALADPDPAGAAGAARRPRQPFGERTGAALCDVAARDHEASRRAVGRRPDRAREDRPHGRVPADRQADGAGDGLAQPLPALLVRNPRPPCRFCGGRPMASQSSTAARRRSHRQAKPHHQTSSQCGAREKSTPRGPTRKK